MVKVAVAQLQASAILEVNTLAVLREIRTAAAQGAAVVAFAETALTGYFAPVMEVLAGVGSASDAARAALLRAEQRVRECCAEHAIAAVVGTVTLCPLPSAVDGGVGGGGGDATHTTPGGAPAAVILENSALVISATGEDLLRQPKLQLVPTDAWARPGAFVGTFELAASTSASGDEDESPVLCSVIICHDSRHPELVRLPVLRGVRLVFYVSWETWHDDGPVPLTEEHLAPYRAQCMARAVENNVFLAHANVAANLGEGEGVRALGSHGCSKLISPRGDVLGELAPDVVGAVLALELDVHGAASARYAAEATQASFFLRNWWERGAANVRMPAECRAAAAADRIAGEAAAAAAASSSS